MPLFRYGMLVAAAWSACAGSPSRAEDSPPAPQPPLAIPLPANSSAYSNDDGAADPWETIPARTDESPRVAPDDQPAGPLPADPFDAPDEPEPLFADAPPPSAPSRRPVQRVSHAALRDDLDDALRDVQQQLYRLEQENVQLRSSLKQLADWSVHHGRRGPYFQVSPLRSPSIDGLGPAPVHYESELAALEYETGAADEPVLFPEIMADGAVITSCETCDGEGCGAYGPPGGWRLSIDWLQWKASRNGLDFVISGDDDADAVGPGNLKRVRQGRNNGARLALFRQSSAGWNAGFRWTTIDSQGRNSVFDADASMSATRIHPTGADIGDGDIADAKSRWRVDYNVIDLEAGRWIDWGRTASLRPFGGLRIARIDQHQDTRYSNTQGFTSGDLVVINEVANMSGVGLFAGGEGHWHVPRTNFSLFGRFAGGLLVGAFDVSNRQFEPDNVAGTDLIVAVKDDHRDVVTSLEAAGGVAWRVWDRRPATLDVEVGYELHYWDNLADFIRFVDDVNDGINDRSSASLGLDGFFGRLVISR